MSTHAFGRIRRSTALVIVACGLSFMANASPRSAALPDLAGTAWLLVEITYMNDTVSRPGESHTYRLVFHIDGSVSVEADCNTARGKLTVWDPPRLQFSDFAGTRAACGPGSLSTRYLAELGRVRSFVYREGHLYLATMADGSIIEFAPVPAAEATATVGRLSLSTDDPDALRSIILSRLLDAYGASAGVTVSNEEIARYLKNVARRLREELGDEYEDASSLSGDEREEIERMQRAMASALIGQWKVNKALHEEYGGRLIYQQLGPEPLDAYLAFLRKASDVGKFRIQRPELEAAFWSFFHDDGRHVFIRKDSEEAAFAFETAPWEPAE